MLYFFPPLESPFVQEEDSKRIKNLGKEPQTPLRATEDCGVCLYLYPDLLEIPEMW